VPYRISQDGDGEDGLGPDGTLCAQGDDDRGSAPSSHHHHHHHHRTDTTSRTWGPCVRTVCVPAGTTV